MRGARLTRSQGMDDETLELLRCLQSGPYDEAAWKTVRSLLRTQRRLLRAQQDLGTLTDIVHLLDVWSQTCESPRVGADALREAADIAERDLSQAPLAADLRKRALSRSHEEEPPRAAGNPHALLGKRRADAGDFDGAIEAYERALNVDAEMETVYHLAELYSRRGEPGDAQQAADLYCTLGDVLGHPAGLTMLQRAIEQVPDHAEARALIAQYATASATAAETEPANENAEANAAPAKPAIPSAASLRARTQPKPVRTQSKGLIASNVRAQPAAATAFARAQPAAAPIALDELDAPNIRDSSPANLQEPVVEVAPYSEPDTSEKPTVKAGSGKPLRSFQTRTQSGIGPAFSPDSESVAPAANTNATLSNPTPIAAVSEATRTSADPPPLRAAERRAAGIFPAPQPAPVITIVRSAPTAMASFSPTAAATQPATSLSPVTVEEPAIERSRTRLQEARARKRKLLGATIGAASIAALGVLAIAPRSIDEAQHLAKRMFGTSTDSTSNTTSTSSASRPQSESAPPTPASEPTPAPAASTPTPAPAPNAPAPAPVATTPAVPETKPVPAPQTTTGTVKPVLELLKTKGGKFTDVQLSAALEKTTPKLDACYTQALEKKPRLKGRLNVAWTVRPNGKAVAVKKQGGTIKDPELMRCTLDAITATKFPKRKQPVQIRVPLEYRKQ